MLNQTTNTRFSKHRRTNVSESMIAALADDDSSCDDESHQGLRQDTPINRTHITRLSSLDEHTSESCISNCSNMFCGSGHFKKQERIMNKFVTNKRKRKLIGDSQQEGMQQFLLNNEME